MAEKRRLKDIVRTRMRVVASAYGLLVVWLAVGAPTNLESVLSVELPTWVSGLVPGLALTLVGWLDRLGNAAVKETIVFWRLKARLPGFRAFQPESLRQDGRINVARLRERMGGRFPVAPDKQNAAWYELYQRHQTEPSVEVAHLDYLTFREMTWFSVIAALGTVILAIAVGSWVLADVAGVVVVVGVATCFVARNSAMRFMNNVLAIEGSQESPAAKSSTPPPTKGSGE